MREVRVSRTAGPGPGSASCGDAAGLEPTGRRGVAQEARGLQRLVEGRALARNGRGGKGAIWQIGDVEMFKKFDDRRRC